MRISLKHNFCFVSKPKSASESIRAMLDPYSEFNEFSKPELHPHLTAVQLRSIVTELGGYWEKMFTFTTLRNPWDMVVSYYFYARPDKGNRFFWMPGWQEDNPMEFDYFVLHGKTYGIGQGHWLDDITDASIKNYAFDETGKKIITKIYAIEKINTLVHDLSEYIGQPLILQKINSSQRNKDYRNSYNDETKKRIEKLFLIDIELGGYLF